MLHALLTMFCILVPPQNDFSDVLLKWCPEIKRDLAENPSKALAKVTATDAAGKPLHEFNETDIAAIVRTMVQKKFEGMSEKERSAAARVVIPLLKSRSTDLALEAINLLLELKHAPVKELLALLKARDGNVRFRAASVLAAAQPTDDPAELTPFLKDPEAAVRRNAVIMLGRLKTTAVAGDLIPLLNDPDTEVRWKAIDALGAIGTATHAKNLLPLLKDSFSIIRQRAVMSLGIIKAEGSVKEIAALQGDADVEVSGWSAVALVELGRKGEVTPRGKENLLKTLAGIPKFRDKDDLDTPRADVAARTLGITEEEIDKLREQNE